LFPLSQTASISKTQAEQTSNAKDVFHEHNN